jgi:hypothetical protein
VPDKLLSYLRCTAPNIDSSLTGIGEISSECFRSRVTTLSLFEISFVEVSAQPETVNEALITYALEVKNPLLIKPGLFKHIRPHLPVPASSLSSYPS